MARRKNTKRFDPRYFMDEKTDIIKEEVEKTVEGWESESDATRRMAKRFTGGQIDIDPLSDEEQTASSEAYYELFEFLADSNLPGSKPSEKLQYALRWIAKFEQGGMDRQSGAESKAKETPEDEKPMLRQRGDGSYYRSSDKDEKYK